MGLVAAEAAAVAASDGARLTPATDARTAWRSTPSVGAPPIAVAAPMGSPSAPDGPPHVVVWTQPGRCMPVPREGRWSPGPQQAASCAFVGFPKEGDAVERKSELLMRQGSPRLHRCSLARPLIMCCWARRRLMASHHWLRAMHHCYRPMSRTGALQKLCRPRPILTVPQARTAPQATCRWTARCPIRPSPPPRMILCRGKVVFRPHQRSQRCCPTMTGPRTLLH